MKKGVIFNIQRFSLYDGPGIRTAVFFKGCPLKCIWCHNPEGLSPKPQIMFDARKCIGCKECEICPSGCHSFEDCHTFNREKCVFCVKCADVCPSLALTVAGLEMTSEEVFKEIIKDEKLYKESGGGVTLSGGEVLLQYEFAAEILKLCKESGISTCVETSGFGSSESIKCLSSYTDLFLYDYKAEKEDHKKLCGAEQDIILENLSLLDKTGKTVILRCPIVPGANDTKFHIEGIGKISKKFSCIREIQLEAYHALGVSKAVQLGINAYFETNSPDKEKLNEYCKTITGVSGKKCTVS